ncbi:MAG: M20/M25/M40 family metallo-hydrolase [Thermoflexales bacterium]|nr:M20/M25/M40 family metallo-hydrolase [Thermoflexales bacterium]
MPTNLADLTAQLVAIESINPDLVPTGSGEARVAAFIAAWAQRHGLEAMIEEAAPGRPNVIVIARGTGGGRTLMLNGHIDTVGVAGMREPFTPRVEGGRLYGRGAFDMKASVAACLITALRARALRLRGDVIVTAVSDEEYASIGTQAILRRWTADAAIITEPSGLRACVAHKGFVWAELETRGVAAHGSRPNLGVDAIAKMGGLLVGLEAQDAALRATPLHPRLGSGSLHASLISGGQELSSYPERCVVAVERRTVPGETGATVLAQLQGLIAERRRIDPGLQAEARITLERQPFAVPDDAEIVRLVVQAATGVLGAPPELYGDTPWMDSALLQQAGIPTVIFGPRGGGAHAVEEWIELDSVERCAEIYLAVASTLCA